MNGKEKNKIKVVIIGCGQMGGAILDSLSKEKKYQLIAVDPDPGSHFRAEASGARTLTSLGRAPAGQIYIIAVKPQDIQPVLKELSVFKLKKAVVVSIAAGIKISTLEEKLPHLHIIRAMPNIALIAGEGVTALASGRRVSSGDLDMVKDLFSLSGDCRIIDEKLFDSLTAVSGSGPAYFFYIAHQMEKFLIENGMEPAPASELVAQTIKGSGELMANSSRSTKDLMQSVISPGGTTEQAIKYFKEKNLDKIFNTALKKASLRSRELSGTKENEKN